MCEFTVIVDGEKIMEDVIYASLDEEGVTLRDIIGATMLIGGAFVKRVDVMKTELILERSKK